MGDSDSNESNASNAASYFASSSARDATQQYYNAKLSMRGYGSPYMFFVPAERLPGLAGFGSHVHETAEQRAALALLKFTMTAFSNVRLQADVKALPVKPVYFFEVLTRHEMGARSDAQRREEQAVLVRDLCERYVVAARGEGRGVVWRLADALQRDGVTTLEEVVAVGEAFARAPGGGAAQARDAALLCEIMELILGRQTPGRYVRHVDHICMVEARLRVLGADGDDADDVLQMHRLPSPTRAGRETLRYFARDPRTGVLQVVVERHSEPRFSKDEIDEAGCYHHGEPQDGLMDTPNVAGVRVLVLPPEGTDMDAALDDVMGGNRFEAAVAVFSAPARAQLASGDRVQYAIAQLERNARAAAAAAANAAGGRPGAAGDGNGFVSRAGVNERAMRAVTTPGMVALLDQSALRASGGAAAAASTPQRYHVAINAPPKLLACVTSHFGEYMPADAVDDNTQLQHESDDRCALRARTWLAFGRLNSDLAARHGVCHQQRSYASYVHEAGAFYDALLGDGGALAVRNGDDDELLFSMPIGALAYKFHEGRFSPHLLEHGLPCGGELFRAYAREVDVLFPQARARLTGQKARAPAASSRRVHDGKSADARRVLSMIRESLASADARALLRSAGVDTAPVRVQREVRAAVLLAAQRGLCSPPEHSSASDATWLDAVRCAAIDALAGSNYDHYWMLNGRDEARARIAAQPMLMALKFNAPLTSQVGVVLERQEAESRARRKIFDRTPYEVFCEANQQDYRRMLGFLLSARAPINDERAAETAAAAARVAKDAAAEAAKAAKNAVRRAARGAQTEAAAAEAHETAAAAQAALVTATAASAAADAAAAEAARVAASSDTRLLQRVVACLQRIHRREKCVQYTNAVEGDARRTPGTQAALVAWVRERDAAGKARLMHLPAPAPVLGVAANQRLQFYIDALAVMGVAFHTRHLETVIRYFNAAWYDLRRILLQTNYVLPSIFTVAMPSAGKSFVTTACVLALVPGSVTIEADSTLRALASGRSIDNTCMMHDEARAIFGMKDADLSAEEKQYVATLKQGTTTGSITTRVCHYNKNGDRDDRSFVASIAGSNVANANYLIGDPTLGDRSKVVVLMQPPNQAGVPAASVRASGGGDSNGRASNGVVWYRTLQVTTCKISQMVCAFADVVFPSLFMAHMYFASAVAYMRRFYPDFAVRRDRALSLLLTECRTLVYERVVGVLSSDASPLFYRDAQGALQLRPHMTLDDHTLMRYAAPLMFLREDDALMMVCDFIARELCTPEQIMLKAGVAEKCGYMPLCPDVYSEQDLADAAAPVNTHEYARFWMREREPLHVDGGRAAPECCIFDEQTLDPNFAYMHPRAAKRDWLTSIEPVYAEGATPAFRDPNYLLLPCTIKGLAGAAASAMRKQQRETQYDSTIAALLKTYGTRRVRFPRAPPVLASDMLKDGALAAGDHPLAPPAKSADDEWVTERIITELHVTQAMAVGLIQGRASIADAKREMNTRIDTKDAQQQQQQAASYSVLRIPTAAIDYCPQRIIAGWLRWVTSQASFRQRDMLITDPIPGMPHLLPVFAAARDPDPAAAYTIELPAGSCFDVHDVQAAAGVSVAEAAGGGGGGAGETQEMVHRKFGDDFFIEEWARRADVNTPDAQAFDWNKVPDAESYAYRCFVERHWADPDEVDAIVATYSPKACDERLCSNVTKARQRGADCGIIDYPRDLASKKAAQAGARPAHSDRKTHPRFHADDILLREQKSAYGARFDAEREKYEKATANTRIASIDEGDALEAERRASWHRVKREAHHADDADMDVDAAVAPPPSPSPSPSPRGRSCSRRSKREPVTSEDDSDTSSPSRKRAQRDQNAPRAKRQRTRK